MKALINRISDWFWMSEDQCGPAGNNFFSRLISKLIPDRIWIPFFGWLDFGSCCGEHDDDYADDDRRKKADKSFRRCIRCKFNDAAAVTAIVAFIFFLVIPLYPPLYVGLAVYAGMRVLGWFVSGWYYIGVRAFGWACDKD